MLPINFFQVFRDNVKMLAAAVACEFRFTCQRAAPPRPSSPQTLPTPPVMHLRQTRPGPESQKPPGSWRKTCRSRWIHPRTPRTCRTKFWRLSRGRWAPGRRRWSPRTRYDQTCSHHTQRRVSEGWDGSCLAAGHAQNGQF